MHCTEFRQESVGVDTVECPRHIRTIKGKFALAPEALEPCQYKVQYCVAAAFARLVGKLVLATARRALQVGTEKRTKEPLQDL